MYYINVYKGDQIQQKDVIVMGKKEEREKFVY